MNQRTEPNGGMKSKHFRLNSADFVILLAVAAIFCGIFFRKPAENLINRLFETAKISYTAEVSDGDAGALHLGAMLFDADGNNIGTLTEILTAEPGSPAAARGGAPTLSVAADGRYDNLGTYVGDAMVFVAPGKTLEIRGENGKMIRCVVKKVEIIE